MTVNFKRVYDSDDSRIDGDIVSSEGLSRGTSRNYEDSLSDSGSDDVSYNEGLR